MPKSTASRRLVVPALPSGPRHLLVSRRPRFVRDRPLRSSPDRSPTQRLCRRAPDLARPSSSCRGGVGVLSLAALLSSPRRRDSSRRRLVLHRRRLRVRPRASSRARAPRPSPSAPARLRPRSRPSPRVVPVFTPALLHPRFAPVVSSHIDPPGWVGGRAINEK